jgi:hypothetical protein
MELWLLLHIPTAVLGLLIVGLSAALAVAGLLVVRWRVPLRVLERNNELARFFMSFIGTTYAILLAFVTIATWQTLSAAHAAVAAEANSLGDLVRLVQQFPAAQRHELLVGIRSYALSVTRYEWKSMARAEPSPETFAALNSMWQAYATVGLQTERDRVLYGESLRYLAQVSDHRRDRILAARATIPPTLWIVLLVGGAMTIGFTFLFGSTSLRAQALMTAWLGGAIGLLLFVILVLNLPFTGDVSVPSTVFDQVFKLLDVVGTP